VDAYIRAAANISPLIRVVDRIFEETEGNPFFLSEVVNLMTQEGTLSRESVSDIAVPDGVREALGRRLDRISPEANELLQVCAVAGREFAYDTLTLLGERKEEELLRLIEESIAARVIEEMDQPGRYRFTHALMQETLLDELTTTRRVRLHGQVGEALEKRWGDRADQNASRLANHFVEAAVLTPRHAERALKYARMAAEQAETQTAWEEAARWYGQALTVLGGSETPEPHAEADLLVHLARCDQNSNRFREAFRSYSRAITLFRHSRERVPAARAAVQLLDIPMVWERRREILVQALADLGEADPRLRALLLLQGSDGYTEEGDRFAQEGATLAEGKDWPEVELLLLRFTSRRLVGSGRPSEAAASFGREHHLATHLGDLRAAGFALNAKAYSTVMEGDLDAAMAVSREGLAFAEQHHLRVSQVQQHAGMASIHLARCDIAAYEHSLAAADGLSWTLLLVGAKARMEGRPADALAAVPAPDNSIVPYFWPQFWAERACSLAMLGEPAEAELEFDRFWALLEPRHLVGGHFQTGVAIGVEALQLLGRQASAKLLYDKYLPTQVLTAVPVMSHDRVGGDLALLCERIEDAEKYFRAGLAVCEREKLPIEAGRCHLGLAKVAIAGNDATAAIAHLEAAAEPFRRYGAKFYLDQVIALKVQIQGITSEDIRSSIVAINAAVQSEHPDLRQQTAPDGTVTLLFSDIENSTPLNERLGDAKWMELLRSHNAVIDAQVKAHAGYVVKTMGDGYMVAFKSAADGLRCAIAIQKAMALTPNPSPDPAGEGSLAGIRVRIGLHTGEMTREGDDFFGRHVNLAARVASAASGGEILVSGLVHDLVAGQGFQFTDAGERSMKGFDEPVRVWRVHAQT
jgi:class 3 adenylate cyclase